jgi:hypothetical protein
MATNDSSNEGNITAEELLAQLRALRTRIPEYMQKSTREVQSLQSAANVDPAFANASFSAIGASETLQTALETTAEECVQISSDASRWSAIEDELAAMHQGVRNANLTRRHRVGVISLQAYSMTRQLLRNPKHADLRPHYAEMKRLNRFGKKKSATRPAPQQPPAPQQTKSHATDVE